MFPHLDPTNLFLVYGILVILKFANLNGTSGQTLLDSPKSQGLLAILLGLYISFWFGDRSPQGYGDTINYYMGYQNYDADSWVGFTFQRGSEWVWNGMEGFFKSNGFSFTTFMTCVALGYVMSAVFAAIKFCPTSPYLCTLFVLTSLNFYGFGVNGLRNGLACHMVMLAISFLLDDKRIIAGALAFLAFGVHRSCLLPVAAVIGAVTVIKNPRWAFAFWLSSIPVSLVAGGAITNFFSGLGFDDRMSTYTSGMYADENEFSSTGFRWDFLIYSALPIAFYWYVNIAKGLRDGWYNVIAITYMLSNAFWVMVIRAEFSNRFAYLSWFLYPIVICYPLTNMKIWDNQDSNAGWWLLGYFFITVGIYHFVWGYV